MSAGARVNTTPRCKMCGGLVADERHPCANCLLNIDATERGDWR